MYGKKKKLILVASDTHGISNNLERVLKAFRFDALIFCGDGEGLENNLAFLPGCPAEISMVRGNNDYNTGLMDEISVMIGDRIAFVTHGHRYHLYRGIEALGLAAQERGCDFCIFGHIHRPVCYEKDGMLFLNPGSLTEPRQEGHVPTCAIIQTEAGKMNIRIINALTLETYISEEGSQKPAEFEF